MANALLTASLGMIGAIGLLSVPPTAQAQSELYDLLRYPRNVAEIDLTDLQKRQMEDLRKQLSDRRTQMNKAIADFQRDTQDRIISLLTWRQRERLSQLYYQNLGPRALQDPKTAIALGLTVEQKKKIEEIRQEAQETYRRERKDYWKIMKERDAKYLTVLTPMQRTRWDKMLGPPRKKELNLTSSQQRNLWSYFRKISPLTDPRNAAELEITDRQKEKIKELSRQLWMNNSELKKIQQEFANRYARANGEQRKAKIQQEMADEITAFYKRGVEKMYAVLNSRQRDRLAKLLDRLSQFRYRSLGTAALPSSTDIAVKLGLTDAQKQALKSLQQTAAQAELKEQQQLRGKLLRIRAERDQNYLKLLAPAQRAQWEKMLGQPLKPKKPDV